MRAILLFVLLSSCIWSGNIYQYKKDHRNKKVDMSFKNIKDTKTQINIIFYKDFNDSSILENRYPIKLKKCIVNKICIFDILDSTIDVAVLINNIKRDVRGIKSIQKYKEYHFKQF